MLLLLQLRLRLPPGKGIWGIWGMWGIGLDRPGSAGHQHMCACTCPVVVVVVVVVLPSPWLLYCRPRGCCCGCDGVCSNHHHHHHHHHHHSGGGGGGRRRHDRLMFCPWCRWYRCYVHVPFNVSYFYPILLL